MPPAWVQLHTLSNYSYLQGASHPRELVEQANSLKYRAIALTDDGTLAGIAKAHIAAKKLGLSLIIGSRLRLVDGNTVLVWVQNRVGHANLARLISLGRQAAEKGRYQVQWSDLLAAADGLFASIIPNGRTPKQLAGVAGPFREAFSSRASLVVDLQKGPNDIVILSRLRQLSSSLGLPLLMAPEVRCHERTRQPLLDVMTAVRLGKTIPELANGDLIDLDQSPLSINAERHLQTFSDRCELYPVIPEAYDAALQIADQCRFSLDELSYSYPTELAPPGVSPMEFLRRATAEGAARRYPNGVPASVQQTLNHELSLIEELRYEAYFLTVYDIVNFARSQNILCQGRGSAANSAVCYCLHVTSVNPTESDLLFERFVSKERNEPPDIDVDFEHQRREEVLQYIYQKYGRERAAMTGVNTSYCLRSSIRDVGKALGFSLDRIDALSKRVDRYHRDPELALRCQQVGIDPASVGGRQLIGLVDQLIGHPRHLSQHPGGMVLSEDPIDQIVPIENAAMPGRSVIQWDKYDLDELGILKVDCLGLGIMSCLHRAFDLLREIVGIDLDLASIPANDTATYDMICRAETMGVFQIESRAQMATLPRLRPRCFYDLVIEVALIRPGPIQGQMVHPLLRRRAGLEEVHFPNAKVARILGKTHGVPIFQEQVMRMAIELADFTPGEADALRKAMGAWRRDGDLTHFRERLIQGMVKNELTSEFAERVFQQIMGFGEYGFPESHATSFALLAYATSYLKCHYPAVYLTALLNSQPMGFYRPSQLIREAQDHGVNVLPADVSFSEWDSTMPDANTVRLGFSLLKGVTHEAADTIANARARERFSDFPDFDRRTRLPVPMRKLLATADCFQSIGLNRRQAIWECLARPVDLERQPLFAGLAEDIEIVDLPQQELYEQVLQDYAQAGLSLKGHPMAFHRSWLADQGACTCHELQSTPKIAVRIGGLVILRQRPGTAKGITFVTLEDETGQANLILHVETWKKFYDICRCSPIWMVSGKLQRQHGVVHLIVDDIQSIGG
ncbi:MAG: error-prone DNA polymerase [Planctomycetaceae bacterium]|nr:error-prone DNA polymerase [Planctomycetaceae bacterium]